MTIQESQRRKRLRRAVRRDQAAALKNQAWPLPASTGRGYWHMIRRGWWEWTKAVAGQSIGLRIEGL